MEFQLNNRFLCLYEAEILSGLKKKTISVEVFFKFNKLLLCLVADEKKGLEFIKNKLNKFQSADGVAGGRLHLISLIFYNFHLYTDTSFNTIILF